MIATIEPTAHEDTRDDDVLFSELAQTVAASIVLAAREDTHNDDVPASDIAQRVATQSVDVHENALADDDLFSDGAQVVVAAVAADARFCNHPTVKRHLAQQLRSWTQNQESQNLDHDRNQDLEQVFTPQAPRHPRSTVDEIYIGRIVLGGSNGCCRWDHGVQHTCGKSNVHARIAFDEDGWHVRVKERRLSAVSKNSNRRLYGKVEERWAKEEPEVKKTEKRKKKEKALKKMHKKNEMEEEEAVWVEESGGKRKNIVELGKWMGRRMSRLWSKDSGYASLPSGVVSPAGGLGLDGEEAVGDQDDGCFGAPLCRMKRVTELEVFPHLEESRSFPDPWKRKSVSCDKETGTRSGMPNSRLSEGVEGERTAPEGTSRRESPNNSAAYDDLHLGEDYREIVVQYLHVTLIELAEKGELDDSSLGSRRRWEWGNRTFPQEQDTAARPFVEVVEREKVENAVEFRILQQAEDTASDPDDRLRGRRIERYDVLVPWGPLSVDPAAPDSEDATRESSRTWSDMMREPLDCLVF